NNSDPRATLQDTYTLVKQQIQPQLEQIPGVAAADVSGGTNPQVTITLHPALLAKYNVTPAQVDAILQANSVRIPAGAVTNNGVTVPVVTTGRLATLSAISGLPIAVQIPAGPGRGRAPVAGPGGPAAG